MVSMESRIWTALSRCTKTSTGCGVAVSSCRVRIHTLCDVLCLWFSGFSLSLFAFASHSA